MQYEFWKLSGAGNDFVAFNNMDGHLPEEGRQALFASICRRGLSIGADGILIVEPSQKADFRMRYYNADGGEAETCGNGSRCIARFANQQGVAATKMRFETMAGEYEAEILGDEVAVQMTAATGLRENIKIDDNVFSGEVNFVNTGVPHAVVFSDNLAVVNVLEVGKHLRHHREFAPAGTNANFVRVRDLHNIDIRTYERGVENETLACGTGSIAASIVTARRGFTKPPVRVKTASGEILTVDFEPTQDGATNVRLRGSARIVFRGYFEYP